MRTISCLLGVIVMAGAGAENIALNKPYTMDPEPGYYGTHDEGDRVQLTDGERVTGDALFWLDKRAVGWVRPVGGRVAITIDLGQVEPIGGAAYSTAARLTSGVTWPLAILLLTSDDGDEWRYVEDMLSRSLGPDLPAAVPPAVHTFMVDGLKAKGRYLRFVAAHLPFTFLDELEVYRGEHPVLEAVEGPLVAEEELRALVAERKTINGTLWRMWTDLGAIRRFVERNTRRYSPRWARTSGMLYRLQRDLHDYEPVVDEGYRAVPPMNRLHERIYAVAGDVLRGKGFGSLTVWTSNRWAPMDGLTYPPSLPDGMPTLEVAMIRNEWRSCVLNLTGAGRAKQAVGVKLAGLSRAFDYKIKQVVPTDLNERLVISTALVDTEEITVHAGETRQLWLSFRATAEAGPGCHPVRLVLTSDEDTQQVLPVRLTVHPYDFPDYGSDRVLAVGGWDYTDCYLEGWSAEVAARWISLLREYRVDSPWGHPQVPPAVKPRCFDEEGTLIEPPDFSYWDAWVKAWPDARQYLVYFQAMRREPWCGETMGTERWQRMVRTYFSAWAARAKSQGIMPDRIGILFVDEPSEERKTQGMLPWMRALREADVGFRVFVDPTYVHPKDAPEEVFALANDLAPPQAYFLERPEEMWDFYGPWQERGKALAFYSCSGPAKMFDPYSYYLGQAWVNIRYGGQGSYFWQFTGSAGDPWNPYAETGMDYSQFMFTKDGGAVPTKQMEAIREGVGDHYYFTLLREAVAEKRANGETGAVLDRAEELLEWGPEWVVQDLAMYRDERWYTRKARIRVDDVRTLVLEALTALRG